MAAVSVLRKVEEHPALRVIVGGICQYEVVALTTGLVPTVTRLHRKHKLIGAAIIVALFWHFFRPEEH